MISRLWPRTWRAWATVSGFVVVFLVLDVLALSGSEFAVRMLLTLGGFMIGAVAAIVLVYPFTRRLGRGSPIRYIWFFAGIASLFLVVVVGSAIAGIPLYPTAEGGRISVFLYGLAFGFGSATSNFALGGSVKSAFIGLVVEDPQSTQVMFRAGIIIGMVVIGILGLCLVGYVALEFILTPIVRSFAT